MARVKYFDSVLKRNAVGETSVVETASVYVYESGTVTLATLYDNDNTTPITNPIVTDTNGMYSFIAEEGLYDIRIVYTDYDETQNRVALGASLGTYGSSTGLIDGGALSINADNTKFDIASGSGQIVDAYTDPSNPTITYIQWGDILATSATYLATDGTTFIYIDTSSGVVQGVDFPVDGDLRDKIQLGSLIHPNNTSITGVSDFCQAPIMHLAQTITDLSIAIGVINESGNQYFGNTGTLKIEKTVGVSMYAGINYKLSKIDPNRKTTPAKDADDTFIYTWRNGAGGFNTKVSTLMEVAVYDDDAVTTTSPTGSVSTNHWVIDRVYYSPDANETVIQVGQNTYNSDTTALEALASGLDTFVRNPQTNGIPLRAYILRRGGASDLSLDTDAIFKDAGKFGDAQISAGGSVSPDASTTVKGIVELATDAEAFAGTDTERALTPSNFGTKSFSGNGYAKMAGGLIIQWGFVNTTSNPQTVTFPVAFPTACTSVSVDPVYTSIATTYFAIKTSSLGTTSFQFNLNNTVIDAYWIAVGY